MTAGFKARGVGSGIMKYQSKMRDASNSKPLLFTLPPCRTKTNPRDCGQSIAQSTNWLKTESASSTSPVIIWRIYGHQGFEVSDEEINMDLAQFRATYANQTGSVECVPASCHTLQDVHETSSRNQLNFFTSANDNPSDQIFIFFTHEKSVGVKDMRKCVVVSSRPWG
jgi:hypothetical protein